MIIYLYIHSVQLYTVKANGAKAKSYIHASPQSHVTMALVRFCVNISLISYKHVKVPGSGRKRSIYTLHCCCFIYT